MDEDRTCSYEDLIADKHTQTDSDSETDTLITILRSPIGVPVISQMSFNTTIFIFTVALPVNVFVLCVHIFPIKQ